MLVRKRYKYRLLTTKNQDSILECWIGANRYLYNAALQQRSIVDYHEQKINYYTQANELPVIKIDFPFFKDVPAQVLQQTLKNLDTAFQRFFKGEGEYPKPKKKLKQLFNECV
jgi:putative transposase